MSQYAAMISSLAMKARAVLKELPLPGSAADSAVVRAHTCLPEPCRAGLLTRLPPPALSAPQNELQVLRLRTQHHEIMVAPDRDYLLIVVQGSPQKVATSPGAAPL